MDTERTIKYPGHNIQNDNPINLHSAMLRLANGRPKNLNYKLFGKLLGTLTLGVILGVAAKGIVKYYVNN